MGMRLLDQKSLANATGAKKAPKDEKEQRFHHRGAEITEKKRGDFL